MIDAYESYVAFCKRLGIKPAARSTWERETQKISGGLNQIDGTKAQCVRDRGTN